MTSRQRKAAYWDTEPSLPILEAHTVQTHYGTVLSLAGGKPYSTGSKASALRMRSRLSSSNFEPFKAIEGYFYLAATAGNQGIAKNIRNGCRPRVAAYLAGTDLEKITLGARRQSLKEKDLIQITAALAA